MAGPPTNTTSRALRSRRPDGDGDVGDHPTLRPLGRDVVAHELDVVAAPDHIVVDLHPHPGVTDHEPVAGARLVHRAGLGPPAVGVTPDANAAVHLDRLDRDRLAVEQHVGREVGGRMEALRQHPVVVGGRQLDLGVVVRRAELTCSSAGGHQQGMVVGLDRELCERWITGMHPDAESPETGGDTELVEFVEDVRQTVFVEQIAVERQSFADHAGLVEMFAVRPEAVNSAPERRRPGADAPGLPEWRGWDLNPRPSGYEPDELPNCSTPR